MCVLVLVCSCAKCLVTQGIEEGRHWPLLAVHPYPTSALLHV